MLFRSVMTVGGKLLIVDTVDIVEVLVEVRNMNSKVMTVGGKLLIVDTVDIVEVLVEVCNMDCKQIAGYKGPDALMAKL